MINSGVLHRKVKRSTMSLVEFKAAIATTMMQLCGNDMKRGIPLLAKEKAQNLKRAWNKVLP